jgi:hypothetical protein
VTPTKGDPYVVNEHHLLSLKKSGTERISNRRVTDCLELSPRWKGWRTGVNWDHQTTPAELPPYLLGTWLADGDNDRPCITTPDLEVVDYLNAYCADCGLILQEDVSEKSQANRYRIVAKIGQGGNHSNKLLDILRQFDLLHHKHIPSSYLINSRQKRLSLLAGLLDGDGYYDSGIFEIVSKYPELASDILFLARSLGFAAYSAEKEVNGSSYHRITISGDLEQIPNRVARKKAKPRRQIKDVLKTGIMVESIGEGEYFGFEVDGDHLFLLGDFTVTHNSHFAKALGNQVGWPCLSLNLGKVFGSLVGESEAKIRDALKVVDAMAPCVLFLDEVEKGLAGVGPRLCFAQSNISEPGSTSQTLR